MAQGDTKQVIDRYMQYMNRKQEARLRGNTRWKRTQGKAVEKLKSSPLKMILKRS